MKTSYTCSSPSELIAYMVGYVFDTRRHGSTYVHACVRQVARFSFNVVDARIGDREVVLSYCGWGRSLQSGGHKYKAHARWADTRKPVPSKMLKDIIPA